MSEEVWVVQTTLPGDWIEALVGQWSFHLVEAGHAACVQRSRITSVYRWEGQCESTEEWRLQIKTSRSDKEELIAAILADHPLDTPEIIAWKAEASSDYADWVDAD